MPPRHASRDLIGVCGLAKVDRHVCGLLHGNGSGALPVFPPFHRAFAHSHAVELRRPTACTGGLSIRESRRIGSFNRPVHITTSHKRSSPSPFRRHHRIGPRPAFHGADAMGMVDGTLPSVEPERKVFLLDGKIHGASFHGAIHACRLSRASKVERLVVHNLQKNLD